MVLVSLASTKTIHITNIVVVASKILPVLHLEQLNNVMVIHMLCVKSLFTVWYFHH